MANINEFKSRLKGGGARANQFKVTLPFPGYASVGGETSDLSFLCTATTLPGQSLGMTEVNFRGRVLKMTGDSRTFGDWTMSVLNDTDFKIFKAFERWMNGMNNMTDNEGLTNPLDYQVDIYIVVLIPTAQIPTLQEVLYLHSQFSTRSLTGYTLVDLTVDV